MAQKPDPGKLDPGKLDPGKLDPGKLDPGKLEQPRTIQEVPPSFQDLPPEALQQVETFAKGWDGDKGALNDFGRQFQQEWAVSPGQTKGLVKELAGLQQGPAGPRMNPQFVRNPDTRNTNQSLNLNNIQREGNYLIAPELARSLGLESTIVQGADLRLALADNAGTLNPQVRASLRADIANLGLNVDAGLGSDNSGGMFGGLQTDLGRQSGQVLYDEAGRPISLDPNGQPIPVNTSGARASSVSSSPASIPTTGTAASTATATTAAPAATGSAVAAAGFGATGSTSPAAGPASAAVPGGTGAATTAGGPSTVAGAAGSSTAGPPAWAPAHGYRGERQGQGTGHGNDLPRGVLDTVQNLLSSTLGVQISHGQTQQFVSQLSQAELSAFLANPSQALPAVMTALTSVLAHGHGNHGKGNQDALLALFDAMVAQMPTAVEVRQFFQSLAPAQVQHLITHRAEVIGNLPGVPPDVRYAANLQRIAAELSGLEGRTPAEGRRAKTLEAFLADRGQFLHFDNAPNGRLSNGVVSQVYGDLTHAQHVALLAFGRGNSMDTFAGLAQRGQLLHEVAQPLVREGMAVVAWLESLSPALGRQYLAMLAGWQAKGQTRNESQFLHLMQQAAAKQMTQQTLPGLLLRGDARLTLVGHSFGSAIVKESLLQGAKPDACVFLGIPEQRLQKVAKQAGCGETDLYALLNHGDVVDELAVEDEAPARAATAGEPDDDLDRLAPGELGPPLEAILEPHHDYLLEGSASLAQVANVVVGRGVKLLPPKPQVITLYRSADGTFGDLRLPVERMTRDH